MKHYCEINESGFKFHFDSLLWRCFPGKFWKIKYQNGVFWAHIEVFINLQMDISQYITENLYEKSVSHYIDYFGFFFSENTLDIAHDIDGILQYPYSVHLWFNCLNSALIP